MIELVHGILNYRNNVNFGVEDSLPSHSKNHENKFLILGETPAIDINDSCGESEKMFSISFTKSKPNFCLN